MRQRNKKHRIIKMMGIKIKPNYNSDGLACQWGTPQEFFDNLNLEFGFTLDPCCVASNAKCEKYFTSEDNGLEQDWSKDTVFMNPPYNRFLSHWVIKAYEESIKGATVVCLLPANRSDTSWWWDYCMKGEIRYIKGRLKFSGNEGYSKNTATFPSVIVIFRGNGEPSDWLPNKTTP